MQKDYLIVVGDGYEVIGYADPITLEFLSLTTPQGSWEGRNIFHHQFDQLRQEKAQVLEARIRAKDRVELASQAAGRVVENLQYAIDMVNPMFYTNIKPDTLIKLEGLLEEIKPYSEKFQEILTQIYNDVKKAE